MPQLAPDYGPPISLAQAKTIAAAAEAAARARGWPMVFAIVDSGGNLILLVRMDHAQLGSTTIAPAKAVTAVRMKRATKALQDRVTEGGANLRLLAMDGILPVEGGVPILADGRIIGAIGVSGMSSAEDGEIAALAIAAL